MGGRLGGVEMEGVADGEMVEVGRRGRGGGDDVEPVGGRGEREGEEGGEEVRGVGREGGAHKDDVDGDGDGEGEEGGGKRRGMEGREGFLERGRKGEEGIIGGKWIDA